MSELQATVEFSVELHKFYNVDLFQRGFYQVRTSLKVSPKLSVKIEVNLVRNQRTEYVYPPFVINGCGVSRTFQILYRNEEVLLDNVMLFRVHLLVDSHKIEETLERADFALNVELWFSEQSYGLSHHNGTSCVSIRTLHLHFSPIKGLHYHLPVLFDYFHLAAVTLTIHAVLVALHQPYIKSEKLFNLLLILQKACPNAEFITWGCKIKESCLLHSVFNEKWKNIFFMLLKEKYTALCAKLNSTKCVSSGTRLAHARHVHKEVCSILLTTYDTLQSHLLEYMKLLPSWQQLRFETSDCLKRMTSLSENAKLVEAEDDFITVANSDIAQLCAENILLWQQFLDSFTCKDPVLQYLAKSHHHLRVKRFSEAFFVVDNPRQSAAGCYDANYQNYIAVSETVRRSRYLASLPPLPVTCIELDGDIATMPIIFEDQYQDVAEFARRRNGGSKKSGSDPFLNTINDPIIKHSVKEEDCSCGIVAILESRSHNSSHNRSNSNEKNFAKKKSNAQVSFEVLKVDENDIEKENVVKATLTIGPSKSNGELITNISTLLLKYKEQENGKIMAVDRYKTIPARQRHSKSLDQLKNTGVLSKQVPTTPSSSITRSTSSQMPCNIPNLVTKLSLKDSLKVETSSNGAGTSPSTDSPDSLSGCGKKLETGTAYGLCEYPVLGSSDFCLSGKLKPAGRSLSMPNMNDLVSDKFMEPGKSLIIGNKSESMPNLIQTPCDSPKNFGFGSRPSQRKFSDNKEVALYDINDTTIVEETGDEDAKQSKRDPSSSSPMSSISDEITSEQSGWVSNSSRHSSRSQSSSGALSPETTAFNRKELPDYSTLQMQKIQDLPLEPVFDGDILIEKLEKLVVSCEQSPNLNDQYEDVVRLLPPQQFRDVPSPPEHFRDPLPLSSRNCQTHSEGSVDNLLYHCYDYKEDKRLEKRLHRKAKNIKTSLENLTLDMLRESKRRDRSHNKRSKRKQKEKSKVTSDEGFDELEGKLDCEDSGTGSQKLMRSKNNARLKNPFQGYLFKEDIETLRKTYENERKSKIGRTRDCLLIRNVSVNGQSKSRYSLEKEDKVDCDCYDKEEKPRQKNLEDETLTFIKAKEEFKKQLNFSGMLYSDFPTLASTLPYFHISDEYRIFSPEGLHLIVCVHGLDGNSNDLRLVKTYLELGLPGANLEFLMSERNQGDTFSDFESMTDKLVSEILYHVDSCGVTPSKISFIGHSLGNIIIRSAITRSQLKHLLPRFHTFLSLSGPHLGTLYNNSGLVNMGMWFMQKWKKSGSLLQLSLKDAPDVRRSFLYRLSQKSNLQHFKHVLLCGSSQDRYVPMHSARIELCKAAIKDTSIQGAVYREMVHNIIHPVINSAETTLVRYDIHHALPNTANSLIGRAAHIAVLDSELFIEKFLVVTGLKYFRFFYAPPGRPGYVLDTRYLGSLTFTVHLIADDSISVIKSW